MRARKVLLAVMPYGHVRFPALGPSLLRSELAKEGLSCEVAYFNLLWVENHFPGAPLERLDVFHQLGTSHQCQQAAEACFSRHLFPANAARSRRLVDSFQDSSIRSVLQHLWERASTFIDECIASYRWEDYAIVGFSSVFNQNLSSLLLASRLKELHPNLTVVFGGANAEGVMGMELCRSFPFIDFVFSGDSDLSFPLFVGRLLRSEQLGSIPGMTQRLESGKLVSFPSEPVHQLDDLPVPVFEDYFKQMEQTSVGRHYQATYDRRVPFESSRGCWWGEKSHCTFCGLNGYGMAFRVKSPKRALDEVGELYERYRPRKICAMDNIMDYRYFREVLPALKRQQIPVELSYELKSNLRRHNVRLLAESGIREVQAGIESLSSSVLRRMGKGVTLLQNVQALRLLREYEVQINWTHLRGFPGEKLEDYASIPEHVTKLLHLPAPLEDEMEPIALHRYSPYFEKAESYGIRNVRPLKGYADIYALPPDRLMNIAYEFGYDLSEEDSEEQTKIERAMACAFKTWRVREQAGADLALFAGEGISLVLDTRQEIPRYYLLEGMAGSVLRFCDQICAERKLWGINPEDEPEPLHQVPAGFIREFDQALRKAGVSRFWIGGRDPTACVARLEACGLLLREDNRYLSLVIPRPEQVARKVLRSLIAQTMT